MQLKAIHVNIEQFGDRFKFTATCNGQLISIGVVDTFTFNVLTGVFSAGNVRLSGVKQVKF